MKGFIKGMTAGIKSLAPVVMLLFFITGCAMQEEAEEKIRDLEFTVIAKEEQPQALLEVIEEKKANPFQISYSLGDDLYLAVGYGEQQTGGYSISVDALYETENNVVVDTTLIGPSVDEKVIDSITYPYVVIKTELIDKDVDFR